MSTNRLGTVDLLRCVAGTMVLWFHLTYVSRDQWCKASGSLGWTGVQIFFVVSGFIIPLAMTRSRFCYPRDGGRFLARRLIRLDPPYLVASAAAAALAWLAWQIPGSHSQKPDITWSHTLAHIGYLNGVLGLPWYDRVCWTLGLEFQFYLLVAVTFPFVAIRSTKAFFVYDAVLLAACLVLIRMGIVAEATPHQPFLITWIPYFLLGISAFRYRHGVDSVYGAIACAIPALAVAFATGPSPGALAAFAATVFLAFMDVHLPSILTWYAGLTYSLYLVHVPVGERVVRLTQRLGTGVWVELCALLAGVASSMIAAYLLFRFVEQPALSLASRMKMAGPEDGGDALAER